MRGGEPESHLGLIPETIRPSEHTAAASDWGLFRGLVWRSSPDIYGSDMLWGSRVTDLLRWGSEFFPENRSLRAVVTRTQHVSRSALYAVASRGSVAVSNVRAFAVARPGPTALGAVVGLALGASSYSA